MFEILIQYSSVVAFWNFGLAMIGFAILFLVFAKEFYVISGAELKQLYTQRWVRYFLWGTGMTGLVSIGVSSLNLAFWPGIMQDAMFGIPFCTTALILTVLTVGSR